MPRILSFFSICALILLSSTNALGQQGAEWIDYSKEYFKIKVGEDALYRIPFSTLSDAGLGSAQGGDLRLFLRGEQIPLYSSTDGPLGADDYIEFFGTKNRGELDGQLYDGGAEGQLNPHYSMFTDTSVYFLVEAPGQGANYQSIDNNLDGLPDAEASYLHTEVFVEATESFDPRNSDNVSYSSFKSAEGYTGSSSKNKALVVTSSNYITDGRDARITARLVTDNLVNHDAWVTMRADTIGYIGGFGIEQFTFTREIPAANIRASSTLRAKEFSPSGRVRFAFVEWTYDRAFEFDGDSLVTFTHDGTGDNQYFVMEGLDADTEAPVVLDRTGKTRLQAIREGDQIRFVLPATQGSRDLVVASSAKAIRTVQSLDKVVFTDWSGDDTEYIVLSHPSMTSGQNSVQQYIDYRASIEGGSYKGKYYNILDIYDQFGYGVSRHPQGLRNFAAMVRDRWPSARAVLIIGKGIEYRLSRQCEGECAEWFKVPTYGQPGADNLLFAVPGETVPNIPVGRIPAISQSEVLDYLEKVKTHDQVPNLPQGLDKIWTKNILHLGGGQTTSEQNSIKSGLNGMASIIESSQFGAETTLFTKTSTGSVGGASDAAIIERIKSGVGLIKFFGHSSGSTLDFRINEANEWDNAGKYPIFSAMGCSAGQIHSTYRSLSESFILEPQGGAIAFIAGSGTQYLEILSRWGKEWYQELGRNDKTMGEAVIRSLRSYSPFTGLSYDVLREQQTITGDPVLRLYPSSGPDYIWDNTSVSFDSEVIASSDTEFSFSVDVVNIGSNPGVTTSVLVEQELPNGEIIEVFRGEVLLDRFRNTLDFTIPIFEESSGLNRLYLTVDSDNLVEEAPDPEAEANNNFIALDGQQGIPLLIVDGRSIIVSPEEFSIVTDEKPKLISSSANAFAEALNYTLQIDTSPDFSSALLMKESVVATGGVIVWEPDFSYTPGTVYYWRVGLQPEEDSVEIAWNESSFIYIPGSDQGWNQSHHGQFNKDELSTLEINEYGWKLGEKNLGLWIRSEAAFGLGDEPNGYINNTYFSEFFFMFKNHPGDIFVTVIDSTTGQFMFNSPAGDHGSINGSGNTVRVFPFNTDSIEGRQNLMSFLTDIVPSGSYVVLYTYQRTKRPDYHPELWAADSISEGRNLFSVIEEQYPQSGIRSLIGDSRPYVIFYQKDIGVLEEGIAEDIDGVVSIAKSFPFTSSNGTAKSTIIGPATQWDRFERHVGVFENQSDSINFTLWAFSENFTDTIEIQNSTDELILMDAIDADKYPYAQLQVYKRDKDDRTAPELDFWRVYYEGLPDLMINSNVLSFYNDTLHTGETFTTATSIQNISAYPTASVTARITIVGEQALIVDSTVTIPALLAGESYALQFETPVFAPEGSYSVIIVINEDKAITERYYFNNLAIKQFYLREDRTDPVLDVTFDKRYITNLEYVSSTPDIAITLVDENSIIPLDDPEAIRVFIKRVEEGAYQEIVHTDDSRSFAGATVDELPNNRAVVNYTPTLQPGLYDFKVIAQDKNGNTPGELAYEIQFEVRDANRFTPIQVFPNPARTFITFSFELSGLEAPSEIHLDIFDATGKFLQDLSEVKDVKHIGLHKIIWDTSHLTAGTYFYKISGQDASGQKYTGDDSLRGKFTIIN